VEGGVTKDTQAEALSVELRHRLRRFELDVRFALGRETLALVGPSGAGKTSVLRAIAGLLRPDHGSIVLGDLVLVDTRRHVGLPPEDRAVGMVFQDGALFPHLTVAKNVAYGLWPRPGSRRDRDRRVTALLERFGIASLAKARPVEISGGERQRTALARAVGRSPRVLLLDEPLSALDSVTKAQVSRELSRWLGELRLPTILVSHDYGDVVGLADRVLVIDEGRLVQDGTVDDLVRAPASSFVAAFTGGNYFTGEARTGAGGMTEVRLEPAGLAATQMHAHGRIGVAIDPWAIDLLPCGPGEGETEQPNALTGPVVQIARQGGTVRVSVASIPPLIAEIPEEKVGALGLERGTLVTARWAPEAVRLVPLQGAKGAAAGGTDPGAGATDGGEDTEEA
jgi:molybdate transport system ATP-binding protein